MGRVRGRTDPPPSRTADLGWRLAPTVAAGVPLPCKDPDAASPLLPQRCALLCARPGGRPTAAVAVAAGKLRSGAKAVAGREQGALGERGSSLHRGRGTGHVLKFVGLGSFPGAQRGAQQRCGWGGAVLLSA